ncbi:MAG: hypothetical protein CVU05_15030 [Bacteroidetes bacterium HGW-Bacteroidetes-21]|nr:MAG: hypothetical protein CVU05_15030 [Bacteroidetes bacterium HGW-Bacteroidetes-21]
MLAKDLLSDVVPALRTSDTAQQALNNMEVFRVSHLPIVNNEELLGIISDSDIFDRNKPNEPLGNHKLSLLAPFVYSHQHIYEVVEVVASQKLTIVPVLSEKNVYLGLITLHDLLQGMAKVTSIEKRGAIIVLEMNVHDYSLAQIAQIVESNNAKIISLYISDSDDSMRMHVTLKLNTNDITSIVQTFNRYNIFILGSFGLDTDSDVMYEDRLDALMRFLNP